MLEYKRQKSQLESRLEELSKNYEYYDDHLRIVDAWWDQVSCDTFCPNRSSY